jgi:hypothetical protein
MNNNTNTLKEKILKGLELTHKRLIQSKKDRNQYLVVSEHGKILRLKAKDLQPEL